MDPSSRLKRALETRDAALTLLRAKGEWMARGDIPFLMLMELGLTLALRTPFQRMPKKTERAKYMRVLEGERTSLPYGLEVWAPKRVLDIEWDDAGSVALIGYDPGEWEQAIKAVTSGRTRDGAAPLHSGNLWHLLYAWFMAQDHFSRRTSAEIAGGKSVMFRLTSRMAAPATS